MAWCSCKLHKVTAVTGSHNQGQAQDTLWLQQACSVCRSSTASCTNLHRLVSKGSRSNLLVRGPSKANLLARPSFSGTSRRSLDERPVSISNSMQGSSMQSNSNLQSMQDLQGLGQHQTPSPQQLNWYRGDSIRGVDREFIYKVRSSLHEPASSNV